MPSQPPPFDVPLGAIVRGLRSGTACVAGVLSGTSADGIDVALVRFPPVEPGARLGAPRCEAFATLPYPEPLGARVRSLLERGEGQPVVLADLAHLHRDLGLAFGAAAREVAAGAGLAYDLVGSHGQTVWHHDGNEAAGAMTLQLGDGDHVASAARAPVVSDFRTADVAAGGEGAPLSALVDGLLFAALPRPAAVLNLGGIANLTLLLGAPEDRPGEPPSAAASERVLAFDVGPANALLDGLARARLGRPFDEGGRVAAGGRVEPELLAALCAHPYLRREPPKTTGRDTFGADFLGPVLERTRDLSTPDLLATAAASVARMVLDALARWGPSALPGGLWVAGGGVHHAPLLRALAAEGSLEVRPAGEAGVDADAREALCFAVLAARCVLGEPSTLAGVTGAVPGRLLGKLSPWSGSTP